MNLIDTIQAIVRDSVNAMDLLQIGYATVVSNDPLTLTVQATQLQVTEPVAQLTDNVRYKEITVEGHKVILNPGLKSGDKVLVLKANAGQNYIVISKV